MSARYDIGYLRNEGPPDDGSTEFERRVTAREAEIWADPELVSEAMQSLACLEVRGRRSGSYELGGVTHTYSHPPCITGLPGIAALRDKDYIALGQMMRAEVAETIRQRAIDDVEEEMDR
jgi:hypothetical protein